MNQTKFSLLPSVVILCLLYAVSIAVVFLSIVTEYKPDDGTGNLRLIIFLLLIPIIVKYLIQLTTTLFYSLVERFREAKGDCPLAPTVTVLIPAWNEEVGIIKTLNSVIDTQYNKLEIIVINDGSTDGTHKLVTQFIDQFDKNNLANINIKYLPLMNGGKAKALNQGLKVATGEFIVTIDADSVMESNAIVNIIKRFTDDKVGAVAGNVIIGNRRKPIEVMQQLEYLYGFFFKRADSTFNSVYIIGGAAAAYRKDVLLELGGFDHEIITEDIEMSTRILAHGYNTRYAADAIIYTEGPSDWRGLCQQRLRWKFGRLLTFIKHRKLFFSFKKEHNSYLTFLLLPVAVYAELALLFEAVLLSIFYGYTIYTSDYLPLVFLILFITMVITLQIIFDPKSGFHKNLLLLAPVAWIVFYIMDIVEFQALYRSLKLLIKRQNMEWQKWARVGLLGQLNAQTVVKADTK